MVRLGQNFLADPNLLDAIVRDSGVGPDDTVLEVGVGEGVLTRRLADRCRHVQVIEIDRDLAPGVADLEACDNVELIWADAVRFELAKLDPAPTAMVANLPYSVAVPVLLRTTVELPTIRSWTVMVQREVADRLRAEPGSRTYGIPSVLLQLAGPVSLVRKVPRQVFRPPPRVDSAVIRVERTGPGADDRARTLVRAAFAHRRKAMARSVDTVLAGSGPAVRAGLEELGLNPAARAEALSPQQFRELAGLSALDPYLA